MSQLCVGAEFTMGAEFSRIYGTILHIAYQKDITHLLKDVDIWHVHNINDNYVLLNLNTSYVYTNCVNNLYVFFFVRKCTCACDVEIIFF